MAQGGTLSIRAPVLERARERSLRDQCQDRARALMATRRDVDTIVSEVASLCQPARSRFLPTTDRRRKSAANRLYDGYGIKASEILTNGMTSGLSSPSRPWFKTKIADADRMKYHSVKLWLGAIDRVMYDFMAATNFYQALKSGYSELGITGTEAGFMAEHWRAGMVTHSLTFGEYWIGVSDELVPDTLLRQCPMTTRQVVAQFVASRFDSREMDWSKVSLPVRNAWDAGNYETAFDILHLVEPNPAYDPARFDAGGKAYRSVYWEAAAGNGAPVLAAEGMEEKPFWSARWDVTGNDTWGIGPGWNALADLRDLQAQKKRKGDATDMAIKPPMVGPASVRLKMTPGSYTSASNIDKDAIRPVYQVDYRAIDVVKQDVIACREAIDGYFFVDLFMAITQMEGVQPRQNEEIFSRNEEKLTQLGPVIERVNNEKLGCAIDRVFGVCLRRGLFPPAPPELEGVEIKVDFISILAQAQKAAGLSIVERTLGFIGNLGRSFPQVGDNVDSDAIALDYLERSGFPVIGIRDPRARDAIRAQRAQEMQAAQARETAPALKDMAEGAELLSRTDVRGAPLLDALVGAGG